MDTDSAENKRKRQDSINNDAAQQPPTASASEVETPEATEAPVGPQVNSSPSKKQRTSTTGDTDTESSTEDAKTVTKSVQAIELEKKTPTTGGTPTFGVTAGSAFGKTFGGGFASAAKKASPFAAFTSSGTSGFAKYATKKADEPAALKPEVDGAGGSEEPEDKPQTDLASPKQSTQSFEAMLSTQGDQTLETKTSTSADKPIVGPDVPIRTFEEDEDCLYSTKARLFELVNGNWKERGNGQFKVNRHKENGRRRMVMRTDLTFRLILNAPLFSGMKAACERRFVRFTCFDAESTVPANFALRFPTDAAALAAYQGIVASIPAEEKEEKEEEANGERDGDESESGDEGEDEGDASGEDEGDDAEGSDDGGDDQEDSQEDDVADSAQDKAQG